MSHSRDDDGDVLDDETLKSMRAVWLSMRDEDPPTAGLSALMAAAREKAETMKPEPDPWWRRALLVMRRPPVMAFATITLVLGGALVIAGQQSGEQAPSMHAPSAPAAEPATGSAESTTAPGEAKLGLESATPPEIPSGADQKPAEDSAGMPGRPPVATPPRDPQPPARRQRPATTRAPATGDKLTDKTRAEDHKRDAEALDARRREGAVSQIATDASDDEGFAMEPPKQNRAAQPPPPSEAGESVVVGGAAPTIDSTGTQDAASPPPPTIEQIAQQCERAANKGDCIAAKSLAKRIEKVDPTFYKKRLSRNAAVTRCLTQ